ncbi:MAG: threonine synthase [Deltaproteobacteria bacterium]|nr:MAG: threonine synthase [Deltaproteobacteria bacterium]
MVGNGGYQPLVTHLECDSCGQHFPPGQVELVCPDCGPDLGTLTVHYDYRQVAGILTRRALEQNREQSHWRYLDILPVARRPARLHPRVGWTPLYRLDELAGRFGVRRLWVKDDGINPSASFKDRASSVGVAHALALGRRVITAASTGNAASSLSLFAACAGLETVIFVPATAPPAKLAQLLLFGARVLAVDGSYDQAFDLCLQVAQSRDLYCRNTAVNPVLSEGKKTAALEICEQLDFRPPRAVVVAVGDGCIIGGLWKGFQDFRRLGLIDNLPRMYGVQAAGSAPLVEAFERGDSNALSTCLDDPHTVADSICVGHPRDHIKALRAVRQSGGAMVAVEDEAIMEAMRTLARRAGIFAEPAGATALAGLGRLGELGLLGRDDDVVVLVTGNGLKDVAAAVRAAGREPEGVAAELAAVEARLDAGEG